MARTSGSINFFATQHDLQSILRAVESQSPLKYTKAGMFDSPEPLSFSSVTEIPGLGVAETGETSSEPFWMITDPKWHVSVESVPQRRGGMKYVIGPGLNPESVVIWPGGTFDNLAVISGQVATKMINGFSTELMNVFTCEFRQRFKRIKSFFVGPEAEKLLDSGCRLTTGIQSPKEYDLARD